MRLTLRTLLAYLDDVLDPADKEELAQKIESSEFAEDLVHRTRDTVRRLRLSAPQMIGTGMGLDPNSVAEYLDNVMAPDAVGDFERICLESDVHLAEATACHHVLTMILGQPADVDPLARQRMYTIATEAGGRKRLRIEPAHPTAASAAGGSAAPAAMVQPLLSPAPTPQPRSVEIPEYLRTKSWWRSWGALAGLAAIVVVGVGILFGSGLRGWFGGGESVAKVSPAVGASSTESAPPAAAPVIEQPAANLPNEPVAEGAKADTSPPLTPGFGTVSEAPPATKPAEPDRYSTPATATNASNSATATAPAAPTLGAEASSGDATKPAVTEKAAALPNETGVVPTVPPASANTPSTSPAPPARASDAPKAAATSGSPLPPLPAPRIPSATDDAKAAAAAASVASGVAQPEPPPLAAVEKPVGKAADKPLIPTGPPELGTYMGGKTVLLRHDGKSGAWFRIEPRAAVTAGEQLLALPEFRPRIALVSGLQLDLSGGTQLIIAGASEPKSDVSAAAPAPPAAMDEIPTLDLVYGRIVLINPTNNDVRVRLKLGPGIGEAKLARNSTLAVEVERKHVPGQDPRKAPAPIDCRLYAPEGGIVWKDGAGSKVIDKASRWTVGAEGAAEPVADASPPEWIDHEPIGQMSDQRYGAPKIESTLTSKIPADTQLLELFQTSKRKEERSLVARSSIHVGLFVPFIDALRDSEQKASWKSHIDALRQAMALSPESANKVWQTLVDQRGRPAATDLFEMLCGYDAEQIGHTPEQIKSGAVAKLIDWLEQDSLDYRVLAVQDLKEITGKQLMTNPADNPSNRTLSIRKWRARLDAGDLKPVTTP